MSDLLEDAFLCLESATKYEDQSNKAEAATKYYEGCYLLRRYLERLPVSSDQQQSNDLIIEKIQHYEKKAKALLNDKGSTKNTAGLKSKFKSLSIEETSAVPFAIAVPMQSPSSQPSSPRHTASFNYVSNQITSIAGRADSQLSKALDLDEALNKNVAIEHYMSAAEFYLEAIKLAETAGPGVASVSSTLKRRLKGALDRVEKIKVPKDKVIATEGSLKGNHEGTEHLSAEEIALLKRSSLISSGLFLPWSEDDANKLSLDAQRSHQTLYEDKDGLLQLSNSQKAKFHRWARPSEIIALRKQSDHDLVMVRTITPYTIRQKFVTDCSMIASLCICSAFERRFKKRLITSILYPKDSNGIPVINPNGKYMVKLWLNGIARSVIVDDRLPIDKHGNLLCSHTATPGLELWVSIIEKAYMKLSGGYNFPGSNSGVDLFALTGWIPERLSFPEIPTKVKDHETPSERAWERLYSASSYGDCLITVSSSPNLTTKKAEKVGLVTGHAYAVLRVIQTKNKTRLLQLKNPWAHKSWKGRFSSTDSVSWRDRSLCDEIGYDPLEAQKHDDGVFWISWNDLLIYFKTLHLSWNPNLFEYQRVSHAFWPAKQGPPLDTFNVGENPQYLVRLSERAIKNKASLWVLLSRHVGKEEQEGCEATDYLTVHIHRNDGKGEKIFYPGGKACVLRGAYTNNLHVLIRYDIFDAADKDLSLVLSQYQKANDVGYTISCYCNEQFAFGRPNKDLPFNIIVNGEWKNSGGSPDNNTFGMNPMFAIQIPTEGCLVQLRCTATRSSAVNVMMVKVGKLGEKLNKLKQEPILDSGDYRFGFVITGKTQVPSGSYTLVASTFHSGENGSFQIQLFSSIKLNGIQRIAS